MTCIIQTHKLNLYFMPFKWMALGLDFYLGSFPVKILENVFTFVIWSKRKIHLQNYHVSRLGFEWFFFVSLWSISRDSRTEVCALKIFLLLIPVLLLNLQLFLYATTSVLMRGWLCALVSLDLTVMTDLVPCGFLLKAFEKYVQHLLPSVMYSIGL